MVLLSWDGFEARAGRRFDFFDGGVLAGGFDAVDASGLRLVAGTWLDTSTLAVGGSVRMLAAPVPAVWVMWLARLGAL